MINNPKLKINKLLSDKGFRRYFANTGWLFFERILRTVTAFFVSVYVARYLGPDRFGLLSYAIAFVGLFSSFSSLGLDGIVIRELVKTPEKRDELLGTAFGLKFIGAVIMGGAILIGVQFTDNDNLTNLLIIIIAAGFIFQTFNVINFDFQANVKSKYVVQAQFVQMVISSITKLIFIRISAPLLWFAIVSLSDAIVLSIMLVWNYQRKVDKILLWELKITTAKSLLKDSWPLIISGVAIALYMRIDQIMIKAMLGAKEVGYYSAAVKLSEAWYFIPMVITSSLFPAIINAKKESEKLYYSRLQKLYDLMVWMAIVITVPIIFLHNWIINLLYGAQYNPAGTVLLILFCSSLAVSIGVSNGNWLLVENLQKINVVNKLIGMFLNIILNYILIPQIGIKGAAFATLISYSVSGYFILLLFKKTRKSFFNISKSFNIIRIIHEL